jgi:predicted N-acetyltransferase YhbS
VRIRPAGPGDIDPALAVMGDAFGLALRPPTVHTLAAAARDGGLLVAEDSGAVVGTAAWLGFGRTGWLGGITVGPAARGRGLGHALTVAALEALGARATVLLLATPRGRPIYDRLGFVPDGAYRVFRSETAGVRSGNFDVPDRATVVSRDRRASGEDRSVALDACTAVSFGGAVALRPPWPALPIVGTPDDAEALLRALVQPRLRLAVPAANERAVAVLSELGPEREGVERMRLGPPVPWRPTEIWGAFSLFFG